jgi:hypothetical protein
MMTVSFSSPSPLASPAAEGAASSAFRLIVMLLDLEDDMPMLSGCEGYNEFGYNNLHVQRRNYLDEITGKNHIDNFRVWNDQ